MRVSCLNRIRAAIRLKRPSPPTLGATSPKTKNMPTHTISTITIFAIEVCKNRSSNRHNDPFAPFLTLRNLARCCGSAPTGRSVSTASENTSPPLPSPSLASSVAPSPPPASSASSAFSSPSPSPSPSASLESLPTNESSDGVPDEVASSPLSPAARARRNLRVARTFSTCSCLRRTRLRTRH
jgi:hypothetical protein